jgi:predicted nucleic acid-binding protein
MPTIPDSNVVLDIIDPASAWFDWSRKWFAHCREEGVMVVNPVVLAEASARLEKFSDVVAMVNSTGLVFESMPMEAAHLAGQTHYLYRRNGGLRERVLPDFLIGAHAAVKGYRILSRDHSRFRTYFSNLEIIAPDTHP